MAEQILVSSLYTTFCCSEFLQGILWSPILFHEIVLLLYTEHAREHPQMTSLEGVNQKEVKIDQGEKRRVFLVTDMISGWPPSNYYLMKWSCSEFLKKKFTSTCGLCFSAHPTSVENSVCGKVHPGKKRFCRDIFMMTAIFIKENKILAFLNPIYY